MTARLLQILLQTNHPGPARSFPVPFPKTQSLICIMRGKGGQCLLIIKMHLFTGSRPVAQAWFTPALSCNHSQGSGGRASPLKSLESDKECVIYGNPESCRTMEYRHAIKWKKESWLKWLLLPGCRDDGRQVSQLLPGGRRKRVRSLSLSLTRTEETARRETEPDSTCVSSDVMEPSVACARSHPNSSHYDASRCRSS